MRMLRRNTVSEKNELSALQTEVGSQVYREAVWAAPLRVVFRVIEAH